jgi:hypothetical protein
MIAYDNAARSVSSTHVFQFSTHQSCIISWVLVPIVTMSRQLQLAATNWMGLCACAAHEAMMHVIRETLHPRSPYLYHVSFHWCDCKRQTLGGNSPDPIIVAFFIHALDTELCYHKALHDTDMLIWYKCGPGLTLRLRTLELTSIYSWLLLGFHGYFTPNTYKCIIV